MPNRASPRFGFALPVRLRGLRGERGHRLAARPLSDPIQPLPMPQTLHPVPPDVALLAPFEHPFTVEEYHLLAQAGILNEDSRIELLGGRLIVMSPIETPHLLIVNRLNWMLAERCYRGGEPLALVSPQNPVRLDDHSEPQPDLALIKPDAPERTPTPDDVCLAVEVSDATVGGASRPRATPRPVCRRCGSCSCASGP